MDGTELDRRPVVVAVAGPNGAGKSTFYHAHLRRAALRFVNADDLARELGLSPEAAMRIAAAVRRRLLERGESFVFETVFSDPVGDKMGFLQDAVKRGYAVVLCFVGLTSPALSEERVSMRVSQGGHDVPSEKLRSRFPRTLANLRIALRELPHVFVFDNSDLRSPFREIAHFREGRPVSQSRQIPRWFRSLLGKPRPEPPISP